MTKRLFTSESVTEGHPDKICDQISDAVLDAIFSEDPMARVACETSVTTGLVLVMGEITTKCYVDIPRIVRNTVKEIGYDRAKYGFDCDTCAVITSIDEQSPDIALGVDKALEAKNSETEDAQIEAIGAGDQGMMFGFACDETPVRVDTIVVSCQHSPDVNHDTIEKDIIEYVIKAVVPENLLDRNTRYLINPTGRFVVGGPQGDSGLTGRKIIVDTYGGYSRHGGGAFSGKDPTKVDRSAAYAARYVAKNIVAAGLARKCEVQLAYAIGVAKPVSIRVDTFGTGRISEDNIIGLIKKHFDLRPAAIIKSLDLRRPIYKQTAAYGHFGRTDIDLPWERTDKVEMLKIEAEGLSSTLP